MSVMHFVLHDGEKRGFSTEKRQHFLLLHFMTHIQKNTQFRDFTEIACFFNLHILVEARRIEPLTFTKKRPILRGFSIVVLHFVLHSQQNRSKIVIYFFINGLSFFTECVLIDDFQSAVSCPPSTLLCVFIRDP